MTQLTTMISPGPDRGGSCMDFVLPACVRDHRLHRCPGRCPVVMFRSVFCFAGFCATKSQGTFCQVMFNVRMSCRALAPCINARGI